jgi:PAS domain S-box-containing protein
MSPEMADTVTSDAFMRTVLDASPVGLILSDPNGRMVMANRKAGEIFGYADRELIGRPVEDLVPAYARAAHRNHHATIPAGAAHRPMGAGRDLRGLRKDGREVPLEIGLVPVRLADRDFVLSSIIDISARKRAEYELQWLSAAVEQGPTGVMMTDTGGKITYVNARFSQITGYAPEEVLGRRPSILKSGETPPGLYQDLWSTILAGRVWRGEIQNRRKDGSLYWHAILISPLRDSKGVITHFLALQEDVTERKHAEEVAVERTRLAELGAGVGVALTREPDLRRALQLCTEALVRHLDTAFARIWTLDPGGTVLELQASAGLYTRLDGTHARVPVGAKKIGLIAAERRPHLTNAVLGDPRVSEQEWARREGMVAFAGYPLLVQGDLVGVVALFARHPLSQFVLQALESVADIIAVGIRRNQAENALRVSEQRLRTLFETVNLIVLALDANGRVEYVNPYFLRLTSYAPEEVIGASWIERFLPERQRSQMQAVFLELIDRDVHPHYTNPIVTKAGEERMISWHNTVLRDHRGRARGTLSIGEDVTEHARLEEQFRQAQKMEAVGRLAGGVAHDFNNVLTAIFGYVELLKDGVAADSAGREDLDEIRKAADRAAGLTRQLLAFSRQQVLQPVVLNPNLLIDELQKMLRRVIGEDIRLQLDLAADAGNVRVDPGQLQQVLVNLVVNARDAMPKGGTLRIATANVELPPEYGTPPQAVRAGPYVQLSVTDSGVGMSRDVMTRIFEPFFTTKEKGKGTGLGLSTVYGIVKQSDGYIWADSMPGRGTTFSVALPRVDAPADSLTVRREVGTLAGSETILLVEDDALLRPLATSVLSRLGYTLLVAEDAREAERVAAEHRGPIHLLLTDVVMPGASGADLARRLTVTRPETRVLYMSGYLDEAIVQHGVLEPGVAFLHKPFGPEALARKVREVLA